MKAAYFDAQFGAAGDMLVASLLSAGLDRERWLNEVGKIALPPGCFQIKISDVIRCTIACKKVDVLDPSGDSLDPLYAKETDSLTLRAAAGGQQQRLHNAGEPQRHEHSHYGPGHSHDHQADHREHDHEHGDDHKHEHEHDHDHEHEHGHEHEHDHDHEHGGTRHLCEVLEIIENSSISNTAKALAARIFQRLARAESKVHGVAIEDVHFHEVGAIDAIVDVVGFAIGYDMLGIEKSWVSALPMGRGQVHTEHGLFPAPGPAVFYLLEEAGAATCSTDITFECLTPTGAAILAEIASHWIKQPAFTRVTGAGFGAGSKNPSAWPNVTRVLLGLTDETADGDHSYKVETIAVVETNLDDFSPQAISYAVDRLYDTGALDVFVIPATMKKGRSGHLLTVLTSLANRLKIQETILRETSSIGVRWHISERLSAARDWRQVKLQAGVVRIKIARDRDGAIINAQPEFEDCAAYAKLHDKPLKEVLAEAMLAFGQEIQP